MKETLFERLRNDIFYQKLLSEAIKQNKNDYMHRTLYEAYNYKFIDNPNPA